MIRISGLHKHFGKNHVLRGIDVEIAKGEVFVIVGPSGSGKSTLLRCINFLEEHDAGEIAIDGEPMGWRLAPGGKRVRDKESNVSRLRSQVAMVFQQFNLFPHKTVLENVVEGPIVVKREPPGEAAERAAALLDRVGLSDKVDAYPSTLSGGQQQRAAIARALAMQPKAILFDEPTSALDPELVGEVLAVMKGLAHKGLTMVIVTHEMQFARDVGDRVMMMDAGQVVELAPAKSFFAAPRNPRTVDFLRRLQLRESSDAA
ncbi:MAG: amino acid ABC transporter ATP-binding protein [Alphaproteobacteria bacterium]|nr:amino acid ABC transporter ATP-binding protein [Alphaproteobacteria bacterium]